MDIEHAAYLMKDPAAAAQWYAKHLGMRIVLSGGPPAYGHFLADTAGHVMIEIYTSEKVPVPDYAAMDPLVLHLAFEVDDVRAARQRLLAAGASPAGDIVDLPDGGHLTTLRDPWGFAIQLVQRGKPLI